MGRVLLSGKMVVLMLDERTGREADLVVDDDGCW
jgi:hypothetical protein